MQPAADRVQATSESRAQVMQAAADRVQATSEPDAQVMQAPSERIKAIPEPVQSAEIEAAEIEAAEIGSVREARSAEIESTKIEIAEIKSAEIGRPDVDRGHIEAERGEIEIVRIQSAHTRRWADLRKRRGRYRSNYSRGRQIRVGKRGDQRVRADIERLLNRVLPELLRLILHRDPSIIAEEVAQRARVQDIRNI